MSILISKFSSTFVIALIVLCCSQAILCKSVSTNNGASAVNEAKRPTYEECKEMEDNDEPLSEECKDLLYATVALAAGIIVAIVIGAIILIIGLIVLCCCCCGLCCFAGRNK